ncbi:bis(5'-adenosyl)-triphosphatase enpp4 isoform X1 [Hydra vulgaris]|uniref:bis(5'-adenosyl)-triphosphatase enpp4 isoform X1 n=1 Tax=Hydra vulgaris TaxID=6087 RepID=UPI0001923A4C|nr:bis(5'-adenosyl)-triphosphatase enpp4 isoform X1 [Hydra vulgaris]
MLASFSVIFIFVFFFEVQLKPNGKVFMLVFDGFIHNYKSYNISMPNLDKIVRDGVYSERMIPSFPSDTWPTMTTLSTGLYSESHGIIGNKFMDYKKNISFSYDSDPKDYEKNGQFFTQEPLWLTNQKQGGSSLVYYMPGYYAFKEKPTYHNYPITSSNSNVETGRKSIDEAIKYLNEDPLLNFLQIWIDQPDGAGHYYGKSSIEYKQSMKRLDSDVIGYTLKKLKDDVNFIIVADHGFIDVKNDTNISYLEDYVNLTHITYYGDCSGSCFINPVKGYPMEDLIKRLAPLNETKHYRIYRRGDPSCDFPDHLHYRNNRNIAQLLILSDETWLVRPSRKNDFKYGGRHGYDNAYENMGTIFFAKGPAFKKRAKLGPFESVNIVPLVGFLLGIKAPPNNGSLETFKDVLH